MMLMALSVNAGEGQSGQDRPSAPESTHGFAWGADIGSLIDMTGNDMSALDLNACFGYTAPYIRLLGVGASIDAMVSSRSTSYPVYVMFRTDFSPVPQLCFGEARVGVAFSNIGNHPRQTSPYGSVGVGVTLARGKTFSSHIILSYSYTKLDDVPVAESGSVIRVHDLQYASLRIGIAF